MRERGESERERGESERDRRECEREGRVRAVREDRDGGESECEIKMEWKVECVRW